MTAPRDEVTAVEERPTPDVADAPPPARRLSRRARVALWLGGIALALFVAVLVLLPVAMELVLEHRLGRELDERADVLDIDFNPFTGRIAISGVNTADTESQLVESGEVAAEIAWRSLFREEVDIVSLSVRNGVIVMRLDEEGNWYAGRLRLGGRTAVAEEESAVRWYFLLGEAVFDNVRLELRGPDWSDVLQIDHLRLTGLSTRNIDAALVLEANGRLEEAPFTLALEATPFAGVPRASARLDLGPLPLLGLDWVADLLAGQGIGLATTLDVDAAFEATFGDTVESVVDGSFVLEGFEAAVAGVEQQVDRLAWQGRIEVDAGVDAVRTMLDGGFEFVGLRHADAEGGTAVGAATVAWKGRLESRTDAAGGQVARHDGGGRAEGLTWQGDGLVLELDAVDWEGGYALDGRDDRVDLDVDGRFRGAGLALEAGEVAVAAAAIDWATGAARLAVTPDGFALGHPGRVAVDDAAVRGPFGRVENAGTLAWKGRVDVGDGEVVAEGRLEAPALRVRPGEDDAFPGVALDGLDWNGRIAQVEAEGADDVTARGDLALARLRVADVGAPFAWVDADGIALTGVDVAYPGAQALQAARVERLRALLPDDGEPTVAAGPLVATVLTRDADGALALGEVTADALELRLVREPDGMAYPGAVAGEAPATDMDGAFAEPASEAGPGWSLGRFATGPGSRLLFEDRSVEPPFRLDVALERFELDGLAGGPGAEPGRLGLTARVGEYTRLELDGPLRPDPDALLVELDGRLQEFQMPQLTPYTRAHLGHRLNSGQLNAELAFRIDGRTLGGEQQLTIDGLELEAVPSPELEAFEKQLGMPLDAALGLLQDKKGNVRLKLPLGGSLDDPEFDLGDAIGQAVAKASQSAILGILKLTLQPYGAILAAAELAGDIASSVRLDPLPFAAGSDVPGDDAGAYLERIVALLEARPALKLRLCGQAAEADRAALRAATPAAAPAPGKGAAPAVDAGKTPPAAPTPAVDDARLEALARARAETVKRQLVAAGVPSERLLVCLPRVDPDPEAAPRLDMLL